MALPLTTDQPDSTESPAARTVARDFLLARLGSLFAILPLGVWTLNHLWNQLAAYSSPEEWESSVTGHTSPASAALTFVVVLVPLLWHTVWGIGRMLKSRPDVRLTWFSNVRYIVQRLAAIGLLFFLGAHLYLAWFEPRFIAGRAEPFAEIAREMRFHTPTLVVYVLGVLAISYHLANGLWSFLSMGWGLTASKSGIAWLERVALALFFVLLVIGWAAIYGLYAGGEIYGPL
jgi:succinate dehydrogenase / fumarate reductase cytochrome b subunit